MIEFLYQKDKSQVVAIDNENIVAKCTYTDKGEYWSVDSTFVDPAYRGKNLARNLVDNLVSEARKQNKKLLPVCSYVVKIFEKEKQYHDVVKEI